MILGASRFPHSLIHCLIVNFLQVNSLISLSECI